MNAERVLIIEDEKIIGLDLQRRLEKFGFQVVDILSTGEEAIRISREQHPDIILMDIMLEGDMDGIEAAKIIRKSLGIPVIFLTAYSDEKTLHRAKEAEPFGYILKPFKERELYTSIDIALYKHSIDKKLFEQEKWLSAILTGVGDGIIATDKDNVVRFMNPVGEILTGWKEDEARKNKLSMILQLFDDISEMPMDLPRMQGNRPEHPAFFDSMYLVNRLGGRVHIEGSVAPIIDPGKGTFGQVIAFRDVTDLRRMSETISYQASHDFLTGLYNREEFLQFLSNVINDIDGKSDRHSYLYVDIDNFRIVNDLSGHPAGDELLRQIAQDLRTVVPPGKIIGRLSSNGFGILLSDTVISEANQLSKDLLKTIGRTFLWQKNTFKITASIGAVSIDEYSKDSFMLLAMGEDACRIAKEEGGNRSKVYTGKDTIFLKRRGEMQWITRLTTAIEENRFVLFNQHILPLEDKLGLQKKTEILLRLREGDDALISPAEFIPAAERYHLMPAIDRWVIREAIKACTAVPDDIVLCINLSGASIADESLFTYISGIFASHRVDPEKFCFELTETTAIENFSRASAFIGEMKKLGCTFALDDFGNGFSSFSYLKKLPVDYLKIDGSYVKDISEDTVNLGLVSAVNDIGHVMGMKTIAEFCVSAAKVSAREFCNVHGLWKS